MEPKTEPREKLQTAILDIFRIEKAKGGVLASRRMKSRAMKYARTTGVPEYKTVVETLMLDNYPRDFENHGKAGLLQLWGWTGAVSLLAAVALMISAFYNRYDFLIYLMFIVISLAISALGIWQFRRLYRSICEHASAQWRTPLYESNQKSESNYC